MKKTPLYDRHVKWAAHMVDFGGWAMPVQYTNVIQEHVTTRHQAGLFDICHMGELKIQGRQAFDLLQHALSRNLQDQYPGQMKLGLLLNENGGIIDDVTVYFMREDDYLMVTNATTKDRVYQWLIQLKALKNYSDVTITDISDQTGKLDIQGPVSESILQSVVQDPLSDLKFYHSLYSKISGIPVLVSRSGYTGEDGFEVYASSEEIAFLWDTLLQAGGKDGLIPVGLGARDTLRLEAGMMLNGSDMDERITPFEVVYGWITNMEKDFVGKPALEKMKREGFKRKLVGFKMEDRGIARQGYRVQLGGREIGRVTSGTFSPTFKVGIGMAFVPTLFKEPDTQIDIDIRSCSARARIVPLPFYKRKKTSGSSNEFKE